MRCGTVIGDAFPTLHSGVLAVHVAVGRDQPVRLEIEATPAARCIEKEDSVCWVDGREDALWSNRARTVRDIPLRMVVPPEAVP
jgi:hypothetical protein